MPKLIEKVISDQLIDYLESDDILNPLKLESLGWAALQTYRRSSIVLISSAAY